MTIRPGRTAPRRLRDDEGLTLVEMLVVMTILAVVMGAVLATFTSILRTTEAVRVRTEANNQARAVIEAVGRDIRSAVRVQGTTDQIFRTATTTEVSFTAQVGGRSDFVLITLRRDGTRLLEETRLDSGGGVFTDVGMTTRILGTDLIAGSDVMFRYHEVDAVGARLELVPAVDALDSAQRDRIQIVDVVIAVDVTAGDVSRPVELQTQIRVPNIALERSGQ